MAQPLSPRAEHPPFDATLRPAPRLLLILDRQYAGDDKTWLDHLERLWSAVPADGSVWVQLRAKQVSADHRVSLLAAARYITDRPPHAPVLVNGTSGDALAAGFTGVHWPEALRPPEAPPTAARLTHICAAIHDVPGALAAARSGASVVTFSPVFQPGSKAGVGRGLAELTRVADSSPVPVLALGGITAERAVSCLSAGAAGVAVLSAISAPHVDPAAAVHELLQALNRGEPSGSMTGSED